MDIIVTKQCIQ